MDKPIRYSDEVPYEKRRYWYFTLHGIGPGTIPKELKVLHTSALFHQLYLRCPLCFPQYPKQ